MNENKLSSTQKPFSYRRSLKMQQLLKPVERKKNMIANNRRFAVMRTDWREQLRFMEDYEIPSGSDMDSDGRIRTRAYRKERFAETARLDKEEEYDSEEYDEYLEEQKAATLRREAAARIGRKTRRRITTSVIAREGKKQRRQQHSLTTLAL